MANFKSKNLCDKSLKIKNLRWQFSCIFRWLRRGILRFFCRCRYHGDICRSKLPVLQISEKDEKWAFSYGKIRPLEMIFFAFFPTNLLGLSERYVLDPQTLIGDSKQGFPAMRIIYVEWLNIVNGWLNIVKSLYFGSILLKQHSFKTSFSPIIINVLTVLIMS